MDQNTQQLLERITKLEETIKELQNSSSIPYEIDKAFIGRGYMKIPKPPIFLVGADQGSWLNTGGGSNMAFPTAFAPITEGQYQGLWIPLYQPPRQIV